MIRISRSVLSQYVDIHTHTYGRKSQQQQGSRERSHNHRQYPGGKGTGEWTSQKRDIVGPRFPRAIVRYRLPMSVVFSRRGPQFPPRARYFLFIGRLIACPSPLLSFTGYEGYPVVGTRRFKLFALCGSPMILAIILNSEESARKGSGGRDVNSDSIAAGYCERGDGRFLPLPRSPLRRSTISTLPSWLRSSPSSSFSIFFERSLFVAVESEAVCDNGKKWRRFKESLIYLSLSLSFFVGLSWIFEL